MTSERLTKPGSDEFISGMTREEMDAYYRKNERMLHSLLSKYAMPHGEADRDDMLQLAALGFFKGMATFDSSLGVKMSTYCYQCAENEVKQYFRRISAKARKGTTLSLEMETGSAGDWDGNEDGRRLIDILDVPEGGINPQPQSPEDMAEYNLLVDAIREYSRTLLTDTERKILMRAVYGQTQVEIADELGVSQANVCKHVNMAKSKLIAALVSGGYIQMPDHRERKVLGEKDPLAS